MGKPSGFMEYERKENKMVPPEERLQNYEEFYRPLKEEERRQQAARCMNCGVPFCQSAIELNGMVTGCPLHNLIPEWNDEIYNGNYSHALSRLLKTNPFPEFTGRVCPALCEKACLNGIDGKSVTIHDNEKFIIETAFENGWMQPKPPKVRSNKKAAVIGAGPAGLAAAHDLNKRGHTVTVFEREDRPGGLLMYGIPNMKLDKSVIERRQKLLEEEGIEFVFGADLGRNLKMDDLLRHYDAILLAAGSKQPRDLNVPGRDAEGVYFAVDYLSRNTRALLDGSQPVSAAGKHVVIVGGGDTGNDCTGTALRQKAADVVQIEMMPAPPAERAENNPWPQWPKVLKTDYGQQEAIALQQEDPRIYETTIRQILKDEEGRVQAVETIKVSMNNGKLEFVEGSEQVLPCDLLLIAAGFTGLESYVKEETGLETTPRNTVKTRPFGYQSPKEKIFAAGDCRRGQSLVVWAIHEGKAAAKEVDAFLMGYTNIE